MTKLILIVVLVLISQVAQSFLSRGRICNKRLSLFKISMIEVANQEVFQVYVGNLPYSIGTSNLNEIVSDRIGKES